MAADKIPVIHYPYKCFPPRAGATCFDLIMLRPGTNHLESSEIEALKAHTDYPQYEKWGAIEILGAKPKINPKEQVPSELSKLNVDEAEKLIENCHDAAKLESWLTNESRVTLRQAINRRVGQIKSGNE